MLEVYLHDVGVAYLSLPNGCSVAAVFKLWGVVVNIQQGDRNPAVSRLCSAVSQYNQLDLRARLKIQAVVFLHSYLT